MGEGTLSPDIDRATRAQLTRRHMLRGFGLLAAGTAAASVTPALPAFARIPPSARRSLAFEHLHTGERSTVTYFADGAYLPDGLAELNHVLRDWRTGEVQEMDLGLLDLLHQLQAKLDSRAPFGIISAYRSPKTNAKLASKSNGVAKRSLHMRGKAIDIRLAGRSTHQLHEAALALRGGGVGLYSKSGFIHVDTGRVRRWGR